MAIITTGQTFNPTGVVTSTKLEDIANKATFVAGAVDGTSLELISSGTDAGKLGIKDAGITTDKVADSTDKTDGVTLPKIQHISTDKILGRQTASDGNVEEVDVVIGGTGDAGVLFDNDDMLDNSDTAGGSATRGATQQSIKAYVDGKGIFDPATYSGGETTTLPNGLTMKFGTVTVGTNTTKAISFGTAFDNSVVSVNGTFNRNMGTSGDEVHLSISLISKTGFSITNGTGEAPVGWFAVGY